MTETASTVLKNTGAVFALVEFYIYVSLFINFTLCIIL